MFNPIVIILLGLTWLLSNQGVMSNENLGLVWSILVILFGISLLFKPNWCCSKNGWCCHGHRDKGLDK